MIPFKIPWVKTALLAGISVLSLFIIFKTTVNVRNFLNTISQINLPYFWLAFATLVPTTFLNASRWHFVLKASGHHVPYGRIFSIVLNSTSFLVIPGRLGDLARVYPLKNRVPAEQGIGTVVLEKIIDIFILSLYSSLGLFLLRRYAFSAWILAFALMVFPLLIISGRFINKRHLKGGLAVKIYDGFSILNQIKKRKYIFSLAVASSAVNMGLSMLQFYWLLIAVNANVPMPAVFAFLPLSVFVGLIPLTLAGAGTRDAAFIYFFSAYTVPAKALSAGILYALQSYWILSFIFLPLLYFFFKRPAD